jgi:hypothetical protein
MTDNEFVVECIVENIMHLEYLDMLNDLGQEISIHDIEMVGRVDQVIKENKLLDYK